MSENYSPNVFLFQSYVSEVVKEGKKYIKTAPFQSVDPDTFLAADKNQHLDLYHTYFLAAMGHQKTREIACSNYEKLIRQGLVDKEHLPISMISSVLTACSSLGSSTSGSSSLGSASLAVNNQAQSLYMANLIKSILLFTYQPMSELVVGLNYLLQGTRKKYSQLYSSMLQDIYSSLLVKFHDSPVRRLVSHYLRNLVDQVEAHFGQQDYVFASRKLNTENNKVQMPLFVQGNGFGKFGRCFICAKAASHYMKQQYIPICSIECKDKVKELLQECKTNQYFNVFSWILDNLSTGDDIIYAFLLRELHYYAGKQALHFSQLIVIIKTVIHLVTNVQFSSNLMPCLSLIITRWNSLLVQQQVTPQNYEKLQSYFKIYYLEIITTVEEANIGREMMDYVIFFGKVLNDQVTFHDIFVRYDCKFYQPNILARMMNLISQYAKKYEEMVQQLQGIVRMLTRRYIERGERQDHWRLHCEFTKKRQLKKAIALFNKKPLHGIKYLKKMFQVINQQQSSRERSTTALSDSRVDEDETTPTKETKIQTLQQVQTQSVQKIQKKQQIQSTIQTKQNNTDINKQINQPQQISQKIQTKNEVSSTHKQQSNHIQSKITPKHIALFLRQNLQYRSWSQAELKHPIPLFSLQKVKVGEYFGVDDPEVREVSKHFLNDFPFDEVQIDDVLRIVLNSFTLPKQTQQIQRIIGDLSLRLLGRYQMTDETGLYQYIYLLLMVQTSNQNPNVKEKERLTLDNHLSMCKHITGGISKERAVSDFQRIIENPLDKRMKYPDESIFSKKYLSQLEEYSDILFEGQQSTDSISKDILLYIWEYLVIGLIWPGNTKGLWESVILLGREGLAEEQKGFFQALRKQGEGHDAGSEINSMLLKLGIEYGNDLHGRLWDYVISLIYGLQNQNEYNSAVLDKLFTNSGSLFPLRLRDFIQSLLIFSNSEFKKDTLYNRQLFVLRHINSLLEYNIPRFPMLAQYIWQLLDRYFRDICLHPRRQISMAAIDSYKQLTLKLFKLREEAVSHQAIMDTYCHIFERSCLQMKDLIANVLLNLITPDMRGGWESVYAILDVLDTKDKQLVVKIIGRFISEVGLQRLTSLPRLHGICIKQLRVCGDSSAVQQLLSKLWQLSNFINQAQTWLQTIRSIKDIFKISLNNELLIVFVRMINLCLGGQHQLTKEIFSEVVDLLIFLIELKLPGSHNKVIQVLLCSLESLRQLNSQFVISYIGGSYGFLSIYQMYLSSENKLPFALYLKDYLVNVLLPVLTQERHLLQFQQLCQWCINQYYDNLPGELVNLKQKDKDFDKGLDIILQQFTGQIEKDRSQRQTQLIQFHLSHKDYHQRSTLHLIFLDIIEHIYRHISLKQTAQSDSLQRIRAKIIESAIDSYECAAKINKLVYMRNFLWNNGFLTAKALPGLHKQQHRTLAFIVKHFPFSKSYPLFSKFLHHYINMSQYLRQLKIIQTKSEPALPKGTKIIPSKRQQKQDIKTYTIYSNDTALWINEAKRCLSLGFLQLRTQLKKVQEERWLPQQEEYKKLVIICSKLLQLKHLPSILTLQVCQTLKLLYQLIL